ncbi:hypothetical protein KFJ24_15100 [Marinobacter sediminum]|uniref:hypothetical protein n=1 Tax=Marinobacter sediminum TaxID=256323 RepID=UPI0020301447|nr:hypothetical protein [Marinobacter sediminum]MCM0613812.1 hypothetical protein [Marinobacter sediminum]
MFQRTSDSALAATTICASLILSACGGGGDSSSSVSSVSSGENATTLEAGLYEVQVTYVDGRTSDAFAYLSSTSKFAMVFGQQELSLGMLEFDNSNISGTSNDYYQPDDQGFYSVRGQEGAISGTINSPGSATFSASAAGKVNSEVRLKRANSLSDLAISLVQASGSYEKGESEVVLTVGEDGSLDAQYPTTNCVLGGTLVPDASVNVFDITYRMSNCTNEKYNGEYSGLGFFGPTTGGQIVMFTAHNEEVAMQFEGTRR